MDLIQSIMTTEAFDKIKLEEMDRVSLMNRTDTKFWFNAKRLQELLNAIKDDYYILEIEEQSQMPYSTVYYETAKNSMYLTHHNGKLNRYKVRRRTYVESQISYLEIKFKNNKGRTVKKRILSSNDQLEFTTKEKAFITAITAMDADTLKPTLLNEFNRLMLVNKDFKERCTIDINLRYTYKGKKVKLDDLVIVELKSGSNSGLSPLAFALRERRIKSAGFSKYCFGRSITDPNLKRNSFKGKIRKVQKIIQPEFNLLNIK